MPHGEQLRIADLEDRRRWGRGAYELVGYEPRKGRRVHDWGWIECCTSLGSTWDGTTEFAVDYRSLDGQPRRVICRGSARTRLQPTGEGSPTA
jgi:hypothetical protein